MKGVRFSKIVVLSALILGCLSQKSFAQDETQKSTTAIYTGFAQFFTEKVLTVTRESDGILPGTLRTALIQASGIRSQNSFTLVRIVFDLNVKRVRITKGALPEIDGSLTTLDCQTATGRGDIEGVEGDTAGTDPAEEVAGIKITSNGNTVHNCHITGFAGPGILIRGNRNLIEYNTIGYHKEISETTVEPSAIYNEPKTNKGAGVSLDEGANENVIQNNDIVANTYNGVLLAQRAGTGNRILYNYFAKNSGKPIQVVSNNYSTQKPQITKITREGDLFIISGLNDPKSEIQIYISGKDDNEVGMMITPGTITSQDHFTMATKNKGFIPNQTKIVAVAHGIGRNSSEFSSPIVISSTTPPSAPSDSETGVDKTKSDTPPEEPKKSAPADEKDEAKDEAKDETMDIETSDPLKNAGKDIGSGPANTVITETTINIKGVGDKGGQPDSGSLSGKNQASSLGL